MLYTYQTEMMTRSNVLDEVYELLVPKTHFDRQADTHRMLLRQTAQSNQIPEFLT